MPRSVPSYAELLQLISNDLKNKFNITTYLGKTFMVPFATVLAGIAKTFYYAIYQENKNIFYDKCNDEMLDRYALVKLRRQRNPAINGEYLIQVTGTIGAVIPVNTVFSHSSGNRYITDTAHVMLTTSDTIQVRSLTEGTAGRRYAGDELRATSPIIDVDSSAQVTSEVTAPTNAESYEDLRINLINSDAVQLQGGAPSDWRAWAEPVSGVREVYPYKRIGGGSEIDLFTEAFPADSLDGYGTPPQSILDAVRTAIEPSKEPQGVAEVYYLPIIKVPVDIDVESLEDPSLENEIRYSVDALLYTVRPFVAGADVIGDEKKGILYSSEVFSVVKAVTSGNIADITMYVDGTQLTKYTFDYGRIPYLRNINLV